MTRSTATPRARRVRAGLLAAALVTLAACGSDDGGDTGAADSSPSQSQSTASGTPSGGATGPSGSEQQSAGTLEVTSVDFDLELASSEVAAGDYTIELTNDGSSSHDLVVERDGEDVAATDAIEPGQATTLTVSLEPGEYVFYCSVANHRGMGMEVTVTVS